CVAAYAGHPAADLAQRGVQRRLAPAGDEHVGTLGHEALRYRQADTRGRAGDDGDLARQLATIRGVHQLSQDADGTASEASSAHRSSATGSDISALTWSM